MVNEIISERWECPYCRSKFDDEYDAEGCAEECLLERVESPIEVDGKDFFECEYCGKIFNRYFNAEDCEKYHIEKEDKFFDVFTHKESMRVLAEAAAHPDQITLFVTITKPVLHSQE